MPRVYIAGPMRGYHLLNFPAFDRAASLGRSLGWEVISPADLDRQNGINEWSDDVRDPHGTRVIVRRDLEALLALRAEEGDAIAMLHDWPKSSGARAELAVAQWLKLAILDARSFTPLNAKLMGYVETQLPSFCGIGGCEVGSHGTVTEEGALIRIATDIANRKEV